MSLDDSNGGRPAPPIPKAADLLTPQPLPIPNGLTYSTVPPSLQDAENDYETEAISGGRVGLNTGPRLVAMTGLGSFWGFALGAYLGGRQSGLQYLAENAHKLPTTVQGWYFYHKTKNYRVALGGIKRGARYALRTGGLCFVYGALEAGLDDVRGEADLFNSVASGVGSGAIFAALSKCILWENMFLLLTRGFFSKIIPSKFSFFAGARCSFWVDSRWTFGYSSVPRGQSSKVLDTAKVYIVILKPLKKEEEKARWSVRSTHVERMLQPLLFGSKWRDKKVLAHMFSIPMLLQLSWARHSPHFLSFIDKRIRMPSSICWKRITKLSIDRRNVYGPFFLFWIATAFWDEAKRSTLSFQLNRCSILCNVQHCPIYT